MFLYIQESPEVHMSLPRAPDPAGLAAYWAEYEDLCRQITTAASNDDDDNHYEALSLHSSNNEGVTASRRVPGSGIPGMP
ncbi:unnamed protein product [Danaus chrysippus]|uniref:(African queen) hypothetical protein n=1 Tax=Danaus chrysippus TaxID=151541 RepID=A0A8J2R7G6_9NEOP|nr:unnamed protein product [Danaus chrysippus]